MTTIVFIWDNFGPVHDDRVRAVAEEYRGKATIVGIQLFGKSDTYDWINENECGFRKITLFPNSSRKKENKILISFNICRICVSLGADFVFICNYDRIEVFFSSSVLRALGKKIFSMADSKYDDYKRYLWREIGKAVFYLPYHGGVSNRRRSLDYMRFLGVPERNIVAPYNAISIERLRRSTSREVAPDGTPFSNRHFTIVARFVPKKNIILALEAYAKYVEKVEAPRELHVCGSGPLNGEIEKKIKSLGIQQLVSLRGFLQSSQVAEVLGDTLALLLPSVEEQFGFVVLEALAMGVPVILSDNCGVRDWHVRTGVNGFVVEPDNPDGFAFFMSLLHEREDIWREMSVATRPFADDADVVHFASGIRVLVDSFSNSRSE